jgi:hypothetical protein
MAGIARGVKDVTDTGHRVVTDVTGGDAAALGTQQQQAEKDYQSEYGGSWTAGAGRIAGQTLATAPVLGGAGSVLRTAVPALATPAASWLGRGAQLAAEGGVAGAGAAGLTGSDPVTGAALGAAAGPVLGGLTSAIDTLRGMAGGVQPQIAQLAQTATNAPYSVPLNIASLSSNPTMRIAGSQASRLPWAGGSAFDLGSQRAVQGNLIREMGETGDQFIPGKNGVMAQAADRIGTGIDDIAKRTTVSATPAAPGAPSLYDDLVSIGQDMPRYGFTASNPETGKVKAAIQGILSNIDSQGNMPGTAYRSLTETKSPLDMLSNAPDGTTAWFGSRLQRAVQQAFQRSADPADAADLSKLLYQYRVMKTLEPLAAESTTGDISMAKLLPQIVRQSDRFDPANAGVAYTGGGALGDIGRTARQFLSAQPESSTAARTAVMTPWSMIANSPWLAANAGVQRYLRSPTVTRNLIESSLPGAAQPNASRAFPYTIPAVTGLLGNLNQ